MPKIHIFKKFSGEYIGLLGYNKYEFAFDIQDDKIKKALERELNKIKPFRIKGILKDNKIVDFIKGIKPGEKDYLDGFLKEARFKFAEYYFIKLEHPIYWERLENELSDFIASDIIDDEERSIILEKLPELKENKNQIILLHHLLKEMYQYYKII